MPYGADYIGKYWKVRDVIPPTVFKVLIAIQ